MSNCQPCRSSRFLNLAQTIPPEFGSVTTGFTIPNTFYGFTAQPLDLSTRDTARDVATAGVLANVASNIITLTSPGTWRITGNFIWNDGSSSVDPNIGIETFSVTNAIVLALYSTIASVSEPPATGRDATVNFNFLYTTTDPTDDLRWTIRGMGGSENITMKHWGLTVEKIAT